MRSQLFGGPNQTLNIVQRLQNDKLLSHSIKNNKINCNSNPKAQSLFFSFTVQCENMSKYDMWTSHWNEEVVRLMGCEETGGRIYSLNNDTDLLRVLSDSQDFSLLQIETGIAYLLTILW
jgi:hypothetical protein